MLCEGAVMLTTDETAFDQGRHAAKPGTSRCLRESSAVTRSSRWQTETLCTHQQRMQYIHISRQVGLVLESQMYKCSSM